MSSKNTFVLTAVEEKMAASFHMMWDNFPENVMLLRKDHTIIANNKVSQDTGRTVGTKCNSYGSAQSHSICRANLALTTNKTTYFANRTKDGQIIVYWVPLKDHPDYYLHFGIGIDVDYFSEDK